MNGKSGSPLGSGEAYRRAEILYARLVADLASLDRCDIQVLGQLEEILSVDIMTDPARRHRRRLLKALRVYCSERARAKRTSRSKVQDMPRFRRAA